MVAADRINSGCETTPEIYNQGVHDYPTNDYQSAGIAFEQATAAKDRALQERALTGNTRFRMGQAAQSQSLEGLARIQQTSYQQSLAIDPQDQYAKFTHYLVKKKIEELEKKQQQQQQQQNQQNQDQ